MALLIAACVLPRSAHAGRSFYGWLYGTEVMPERGVELQSWIWDESEKYETRTHETWLLWSATVGVTDRLELGLPVELLWIDTVSPDDPAARSVYFTFKRYGIEARYRLAPPDPAEAPAVVPLVRLAVKRDVTMRDQVRIEGDLVASYDRGPVQAVIDVGIASNISSSTHHVDARPGVGISVAVTGELRLGAEFYAELSLEKSGESWMSVGPNLAWTHGRFWLSGTFGVGLYHVETASRFMWGVAF